MKCDNVFANRPIGVRLRDWGKGVACSCNPTHSFVRAARYLEFRAFVLPCKVPAATWVAVGEVAAFRFVNMGKALTVGSYNARAHISRRTTPRRAFCLANMGLTRWRPLLILTMHLLAPKAAPDGPAALTGRISTSQGVTGFTVLNGKIKLVGIGEHAAPLRFDARIFNKSLGSSHDENLTEFPCLARTEIRFVHHLPSHTDAFHQPLQTRFLVVQNVLDAGVLQTRHEPIGFAQHAARAG